VTDLERFFRRLVEHLAATDPARLHRPLPLDEIMHTLVPYRANRRALGVDTSEEYELVVMRLCAGEGSLVRTEPEEARARFVRELATPNPDLAALHSFESVLVTLRPEPLARALGPADTSFETPSAPSEPRDDPHEVLSLPEIPGLEALRALDEDELLPRLSKSEPQQLDYDPTEPEADPEPETIPEPPSRCLYCGGRLPTGRAVNFCPHCGQNQTLMLCPECRSEVEPGWKHCVNCGRAVAET
jgi:Double zinc ribbon